MEGFFQRDVEIVAQISAALFAGGAAAPAAADEIAEQVVENIGHRAAEALIEAAMFEGRGMAVAIIGRPLLAVGEMLVGFVEFLEARLGLFVAGMAVGMALHRRLAERRLEVRVVDGAGDPYDFVEIAFGQCVGNPVVSAAPASLIDCESLIYL